MNQFREINIKNYKSVNDVTLRDCRRYNILIGKPNVGKSNILEALALFQSPYFSGWKLDINNVLRIDYVSALFYLGDVSNPIEVTTDTHSLEITYRNQKNLDISLKSVDGKTTTRLRSMTPEEELSGYPIVRTYNYTHICDHDDEVELPFLCPVTASNLSEIIKKSPKLYDFVSELLSQDALSLIFDAGKQEYAVMKTEGGNRSMMLPLKALADSLLRLIYYKAAIVSNKDAVLVMEEPEAHTYPPYISRIVQDIIASKDNQFFIATHSPYVVNEFLQENADVAIYIIDAEEGKTKVTRLSDDELSEVYEYGIDLFFNTDSFTRR